MLVTCKEIDYGMGMVGHGRGGEEAACRIRCMDTTASDYDIVSGKLMSPDALGVLRQGEDKHFYSSGAFNLVRLLFYVLRQTGPAHLFLTTYSISMDSIAALRRKKERGELLSVRFLIDNRVRSISPKPFDFLANTFPGCYRCLALHAKVALVYNEKWKVSVVGSQNATHNPKLERGVIHTGLPVFEFDYKMLNDEFERATVE